MLPPRSEVLADRDGPAHGVLDLRHEILAHAMKREPAQHAFPFQAVGDGAHRRLVVGVPPLLKVGVGGELTANVNRRLEWILGDIEELTNVE